MQILQVAAVLAAIGTALVANLPNACSADDPTGDWKAGLASVAITPDELTWMAGYASRDKPAEGKVHDLFAKALAVEDAQGTRLVIVTTDLIGIPRALRDLVEKQVREKYRLPPAGLLLNASHTHCGPVVKIGKSALYALDAEQAARVERYVRVLQEKLVGVIGKSLENLAPVQLGYSHARAGFAMNRRLPTDSGPQNSPYPDGPVDHDVPVLRIDGPDGKLRVVLFGYACHNTTLSFFQYCGDYAGYAQEYFEESHPGTTALFLMGCGGDQNPYPRGTLELARQHGRTLAIAVDAALLPKARPVRGPLRVALQEVPLDFVPSPTREELMRQMKSSNKYERRHAEVLLEELQENGKLRTNYPYLIQAAQFGGDLTLVALAGETVVDYSLRLKRELAGSAVWVAGYSNDVFAYVPTLRVLKEGGYEGVGAMLYTNLPGPFDPSVEERIVEKVHALLRE
ncbi:MAG: neutral/alkaline non-lysosomal ceramidase N-terminal domain-containing protein, partial [Deltaproteobacteria bacterium]